MMFQLVGPHHNANESLARCITASCQPMGRFAHSGDSWSHGLGQTDVNALQTLPKLFGHSGTSSRQIT